MLFVRIYNEIVKFLWTKYLYPSKSIYKNQFYSFNMSKNNLVELNGIEPLTSALQGRRSPNWAIAP